MKRPRMKLWTARQWLALLLVGALWFPTMVGLDVHDRAWGLAAATGMIGAGFITLAGLGLRGARRLDRMRRGGDPR